MRAISNGDVPTSGVSSVIRRVRGTRGARSTRGETLKKRLAALQNTRSSLRISMRVAKNAARRRALDAARAACVAAGTSQAVVTVLLHMRAGAASGDRQDAFASILNAMTGSPPCGNSACVVRLEALWHGTVPSAISALEDSWKPKADEKPPGMILVAVEDADRFPEAVIRDIVYMCGTKHAEAIQNDDERPRVALLLGVGTSADCVHTALGVSESAMIAPVPVYMPFAESCFHALVSHVLEQGKTPIILSSESFGLLRKQFVSGNTSIAAVERVLESIHTLQFFKHDLIALFSDKRVVPSFFKDDHSNVQIADDANRSSASEGDLLHSLEQWRKCISSILKTEMSTEMACGIGSARACPSFAEAAPASHCQNAVNWDAFLRSPAGLKMNRDELRAECQRQIDVQGVRDFTQESFENLCLWRLTWGLVQTVTWCLVTELDITAEDACGAEAWGGVHAGPESTKLRMRTALYEQFLPKRGRSSSTQLHSSSISDTDVFDSGKSVLGALRQEFLKLNWSQLISVLDVWIRTLEEFLNETAHESLFAQIPPFLEKLGELRSEARSEFEAPSVSGRSASIALAAQSVQESMTDDVPESREKSVAPEAADGKVGRSTFDSALAMLDSGTVVNSKKRASGSEAKRRQRKESFKKVALTTNLSARPRTKACRTARDLFDEMLGFVEPIRRQPLHEFLLFSDVDQLRALLGGVDCLGEPRRSFIRSMRHPNLHFGDLKEHEIPDVALSYQLLAEGGHVVNVSDWCNTFVSLRASSNPLGGDHVEHDDSNSPAQVTASECTGVERAQAEFAHTVPELEFLGVLKHTNRRADHVLRTMYE